MGSFVDSPRPPLAARSQFAASQVVSLVVRRSPVGDGLIAILIASSAILLLFTASAPAQAQAFQFRKVAITGEVAPGIPGAPTFRWFGRPSGLPDTPPTMGPEGDVGFAAGWTAGALPHGLFRESAQVLAKLAAVGDPAPGTTVPFDGFPSFLPGAPRLAAEGAASFDATVTRTDAPEDGVWTDRTGELDLVFLMSDMPPGTPPGSTFFQWFHTMRGAGHIVVNARYATGSSSEINDHGFWRDSTGQLEVVALARTPAPGTEEGVLFGNGTGLALGAFQNWDLDDQGQIAFNAMLMGPGIDDLDDEGIWNEGPNGLALVVREGDAAPGFSGGARMLGNDGFRTFGHDDVIGVVKNELGRLLFGARIRTPGAQTASAVYTNRNGILDLVTFGRFPGGDPGEQAPGFPTGNTFARFLAGRQNDLGVIALMAQVDIGNGPLDLGSGIWRDDAGTLVLVVRPGQPVPGLPVGTEFGFSTLGLLFESGEIVFTSELSGPIGNRTGLFMADAAGAIDLIVRTGQSFEVAPGDTRTVASFELGQGMSVENELVLDLEFTDGSAGIFTVKPQEAAGVGTASAPTSAIRLAPAEPNPFEGETTLRYDLARDGAVHLAIYDIAGRQVTSLVEDRRTSGRHVIRWDGTNARGERVGAGVYFAQLTVDGHSADAVRKIQRLR